MTQSIFHEFVDHQLKRAQGYLAGFLADHPECRLDAPPWIKGDHLVAFGSYENSPAVYKFYDGGPQKQHEKDALDLYKPTGLVPAVFADTDSLIVMERLAWATNPSCWEQYSRNCTTNQARGKSSKQHTGPRETRMTMNSRFTWPGSRRRFHSGYGAPGI